MGYNKYWALWLLSFVLQGTAVFAVLALILWILNLLANPIVMPIYDPSPDAVRTLGLTVQLNVLLTIFVWLVGALALFALGQLIRLIIEWSDNARETANALKLRLKMSQEAAAARSSSVWKAPRV